jgi:plasmid stabilization system protein ParE
VKARFLSIASREFREATAHYGSISRELGDRFRDEAKEAVERIRANPAAWTPLSENLRRCRMTHFPYALIYTVEADSILIVAVSHLHRDPDHWRDRPPTTFS